MGRNYRRVFTGLQIVGQSTITPDTAGELRYNSSTNRLEIYDTALRNIVNDTGTITLTNKTIDAASNTIQNITNASISASAAIAYSKLNLTGSIVNADINVSAAIVYSKLSLTGSIVNTDINTSAAIARSKLASGSINHVIINDGSGFLSSEATLAKSRGGSAQDNSSLNFPASGTLATLAGIESLSNKSISDALTFAHIITPSNPSAGFLKIYPKGDNNFYTLNSGGTETLIASAGIKEPAKNLIINGNFDFWQRGTSLTNLDASTSTDPGDFLADRFSYFVINNNTAKVTMQQSTSVPTFLQSNFFSNHSLEIDVTTLDGTLANNEVFCIKHRLEGYDFENIYQREVTLSFWVYATKTGTSCVYFTTASREFTYIVEYTINTTNTWEKKTIALTLDPTLAALLNTTNDTGMEVGWCLGSGSDYHQSAGSWQGTPSASTLKFATSNQVNHMDSTSNFFRLSQVCLNLGASAADFNRVGHTIAGELSKCQRYYETSSNLRVLNTNATTSQNVEVNWCYAVTKRSTPTITVATGALVSADSNRATFFGFTAPLSIYTTNALTADAEL